MAESANSSAAGAYCSSPSFEARAAAQAVYRGAEGSRCMCMQVSNLNMSSPVKLPTSCSSLDAKACTWRQALASGQTQVSRHEHKSM